MFRQTIQVKFQNCLTTKDVQYISLFREQMMSTNIEIANLKREINSNQTNRLTALVKHLNQHIQKLSGQCELLNKEREELIQQNKDLRLKNNEIHEEMTNLKEILMKAKITNQFLCEDLQETKARENLFLDFPDMNLPSTEPIRIKDSKLPTLESLDRPSRPSRRPSSDWAAHTHTGHTISQIKNPPSRSSALSQNQSQKEREKERGENRNQTQPSSRVQARLRGMLREGFGISKIRQSQIDSEIDRSLQKARHQSLLEESLEREGSVKSRTFSVKSRGSQKSERSEVSGTSRSLKGEKPKRLFRGRLELGQGKVRLRMGG